MAKPASITTNNTPESVVTSKTFTLGATVPAKLSRQYKLAAMANDMTVAALVESVLTSHAEVNNFIDPQSLTATK